MTAVLAAELGVGTGTDSGEDTSTAADCSMSSVSATYACVDTSTAADSGKNGGSAADSGKDAGTAADSGEDARTAADSGEEARTAADLGKDWDGHRLRREKQTLL